MGPSPDATRLAAPWAPVAEEGTRFLKMVIKLKFGPVHRFDHIFIALLMFAPTMGPRP